MKKLSKDVGHAIYHFDTEEEYQEGTIIVEFPDGDITYYDHHNLHRVDGPAIDWKVMKYYRFHGVHVDATSDEEFKRKIKLLAFL